MGLRMKPLRCALAVLALGVAAAPAARAQLGHDLERVREAIAESRERVASFEREERGLLEAIEAIDESVGLLLDEARRAEDAAVDARLALARAEDDAREASARLVELERALARRAQALYRAGEVGAVRLLFAARDLRDFFTRVQTLRRLVRVDSDLVLAHRDQTRALEEARAEATRASAAATEAETTLAARTSELAEERGRKRQLARKLGRSRALERRALAELEIASRALQETVAAWGDREQAPAAPRVETDFEALRGKLPSPVKGELAGRFGRVVDRDHQTATFRKGVVWVADRGVRVRAVAPGRVRYAGRFRGYGEVVILDHGDDYFTVSAHLDEIGVSLGDGVAAGGEVGRVGDSGSLDGTRLYFEVRRGGDALDPADWLAALR